MPKTKLAPAKTATQSAKSTVTAADDSASWSRTFRETVESVVIAFILAFLFRTFEAEAFVIPTGSMAPTLMGRHKDVVCPHCGYEYRAGASQEVDDAGREIPGNHLAEATCPMCRSTIEVGPGHDHPSYSGDRIIVSKFAYDVSDPERWDVIVFKYPEDAKQNYIKRLIGMPNELFKILSGDIYTAPIGSNEFEIERKGKKPEKLRAMLQAVYYNDYVADELVKAKVPARWQSWTAANQPEPWAAGDNGRTFEIDGKSPERAWLRYQHLLPTAAIWNAVQNNRPFAPPQPSLIQDYYAYNAGRFSGGVGPRDRAEWVGDLALTFDLDVKSSQGTVVLELIKGGRQFRCTIDLGTGQAKLSIDGLASYAPTAQTSIKGAGSYEVSFANVDQQMLLWVDGDVVSFDVPTTYSGLQNDKPVTAPPAPGSEIATDLSPAGIAAEGGAAIKVSHLRIDRDVFYVSQSPPGAPQHQQMNDVESAIKLGDREYFMLGDNSPQSKDSRYWHSVDRSLLIGKALFIYWPHSWDEIEIGSVKIPFPYFPNFGDMGFVR